MILFGCKIYRTGSLPSKNIAVTFDDGPHPIYTPQIMDILDEANGRATFFVTGQNLQKNMALGQEISRRGHTMGNHTFSHPHALFAGRGKLQDEISRTKDLIESITGRPNRYFRPPFGFITPSLLSICRKTELSLVLWNSNSKDYRRLSAERIEERMRPQIKPRSILLFHECKYSDDRVDCSSSILALKSILNDIILKALKPVTIDEMFGDPF